jgi:hypothetical protein
MTKIYSSILDQILDDLSPNPNDVGLKSEIILGDEFENISKDDADNAFLEEIQANRGSRIASVAADWRQKAGASMGNGGILEEALLRATGQKGASDVEKTKLSNEQVKKFIVDRLHMGRRPSQVREDLEKLADLHVFEKSFSGPTLDAMSGVVGLTYLKPNQFHDTCEDSKNFVLDGGKIFAKSVQRIAACTNCTSCKNGNHCAVYRLPIVASAKDLREIASQEAQKYGKTASKKFMAELHDRVEDTKSVTAYSHATHIAGFEHIQKVDEKEVTKEHIASGVETHSLVQVYAKTASEFGKVAAKRAVNGYINSLKTSKAKVAIDKVDCKLLVNKLSSANAIVGSSKCASCVYRNCMSCGLTGGTLVSFPGMANQKSAHKVAASAQDGNVILNEYQLESRDHQATDVDTSGYSFDDVEAKGSLTLE